MGKSGKIGVVAIGRNEGERLRRCLQSIPENVPVAYVDSASTDGSVDYARTQGVEIVELDLSRPFTAARARNEGLQAMLRKWPRLEYIQFVDGDCEIEEEWLGAAERFLSSEQSVAAVCGRRRERYPERSFYNCLCDAEWNTPVGEADACGGDAMFRTDALAQARGYDPTLIAGEEPELCHRLRGLGWRVWRIDHPMTIHDADMHRTRQWWLRTVRSGFGYAQVWRKTRQSLGRPLYGRQLFSALAWTAGVALVGILFGMLIGPVGLAIASMLWLLQFGRLAMREGARSALHTLAGKVAETIGVLRYAWSVIVSTNPGAIFYK